MNQDMIPARKSQLNFYRNIPLYFMGEDNQFVLYKPAGMMLRDMRIGEERLPHDLYIKNEDKIKSIQEAQKGFNKKLESDVMSGDPAEIKETLVNIVDETLMEPRSGSLEGVSDTVDILIGDYARESNVVKQLLNVSSTDYSTTLHSINVMAFSLVFASYMNMKIPETRILGISALLHDVGKTKISQEILAAPRKLTKEEFKKMQNHTVIGYRILSSCQFNSKDISLAAFEHHEKLDGSGYPSGKTKISEVAKIIGIVDCYEALTNNDRPYRNAMIPLDTLTLLKGDVEAGKLDRNIFEKFAYSLVQK